MIDDNENEISEVMTTLPHETVKVNPIDKNYCESRPCINGLCTNTPSSFKCICLDNYTGLKCETRISKCFNKICYNSGICDETSGKCNCTPNYTGKK